MNPFDSLLKRCLPDEEPARRPSLVSIASQKSGTPSLLDALELKFDHLVQAIHDIPTALEEKFDDWCEKVAEIPAVVEETIDDILHKFEYLPLRALFGADGRWGERRPGACVKVSRGDFEMRTERALVLKSSIDFDKLMASEDSSRPSSPESEVSIKTEPDEDLELSRCGVDGEIYLMEMTTPALQTPHSSPKEVRNPYSGLDNESVLDGVETVRVEDSKMQASSNALFKACSSSCLSI